MQNVPRFFIGRFFTPFLLTGLSSSSSTASEHLSPGPASEVGASFVNNLSSLLTADYFVFFIDNWVSV